MQRKRIVRAAELAVLVWVAASAGTTEYHLAPDGSDSNPGTQEKPFATLERAREQVRMLKAAGSLPSGGVTIVAAGGVYELKQPLALTAEDSGDQGAVVVFKARPGQTVRVVGGRRVTGWKPVSDSTVLALLETTARSHVVQADLRALGSTDFGAMSGGFGQSGQPGLELFFNDQPMTLARWPNAGFSKIDVRSATWAAVPSR